VVKAFAFIRVALRETERIAYDRFARTLLVFLPLMVFFFLGFIYINGAMRDIPVAVYDADHTTLSRQVVSMIESSAAMKITRYLSAEDDLKTYFPTHDEHAVFYIPDGFSKDIFRNRSTRLVVFTNSSNIVYGNILYREAAVIAGTVSAGATITRLEHVGVDRPTTMGLVMPVRTHVSTLFNPWFNYLYYLLPGLMTVLLQMFIFFVSAKAFNTEIREGTFGVLMETAGGSPLQMLLGKALAYLAYGMGIIMLIALVFMTFGIPFMHRVVELIVLFTFFTLVNIFLGFMISATLDDEMVALDLAFFYNSPAFVFSGFTFPMFGMPFFNSLYAQFIPYTHFLHAFFKLYQIGTPFVYILPEMRILTLFLLVGLVTAWVALKIRVGEIRKREPSSLIPAAA
jgi:ABC-2 type transport system permease protein